MNILPGNMRFGAGQPVRRLEDQRLLTGKGQFIDDKPEEGALWLYVLRSPHAHAKIVSIDSGAAAAMPGVQAIYTGADLVRDDIGTIPTLAIFKRPDGSPMTVPPRRLLAHEVVRYAGEAVAAVVAKSRVEAQTAAEAIEPAILGHPPDEARRLTVVSPQTFHLTFRRTHAFVVLFNGNIDTQYLGNEPRRIANCHFKVAAGIDDVANALIGHCEAAESSHSVFDKRKISGRRQCAEMYYAFAA